MMTSMTQEEDMNMINKQAAIDAIYAEARLANSEVAEEYAKMYAYALKEVPSAHPEYTENEEKVLITMFTIVKNILDLQDGYMDIDYTTFGHNELFDLSEKLGIDY